MVSKIAALILGVLFEKERNPYEITKMLESFETRKWLPLADSTVYATINSLKKNGFITGRQERNGNLPEKTIYAITQEGEKALNSSIIKFLEEDNSGPSNFDIGILLLYNLNKSEILSKLKKKLERLENFAYTLRKQILNFEMEPAKVTFTGLTMLKHRVHLLEAEMKTLRELIRELNVRNVNSELSPFDMRMF